VELTPCDRKYTSPRFELVSVVMLTFHETVVRGSKAVAAVWEKADLVIVIVIDETNAAKEITCGRKPVVYNMAMSSVKEAVMATKYRMYIYTSVHSQLRTSIPTKFGEDW
jgi:hypothetical protein